MRCLSRRDAAPLEPWAIAPPPGPNAAAHCSGRRRYPWAACTVPAILERDRGSRLATPPGFEGTELERAALRRRCPREDRWRVPTRYCGWRTALPSIGLPNR